MFGVVVGHYLERDQSGFLIGFYFILLERSCDKKVRVGGLLQFIILSFFYVSFLLTTINATILHILQCALCKVFKKSVFVSKYAFKLFQLVLV